jgi:hypothetical protein
MPKIIIKKKHKNGDNGKNRDKHNSNKGKKKIMIKRKQETRKTKFRNNTENRDKSNDEFMYYPEFEDPKFYEKIYQKKEFRKGFIPSMMNETMDEACGKEKFDPFPQQIFLRNYISQETPYNGMLIFHGTGVGKTCTAVGIAEGLKNQIHKMNRKVLVILKKNLVDNFIKTIYDLSKESKKKRPDDFVQCTGNTYTLSPEYDTYTIEQKMKQIQSNIKKYYNFITYDRFANIIMKQYNWDGKPSTLTPQIEAGIARGYSNTVLIIDEVHNIKSEEGSELKKVPPILETIVRLGENNRLILLSATPMYDKPEEIIYLLNLLLQNDKRPPIRNEDIFHSNGLFKDGGREYLRRVAKGYISYLRSENPITNPIRVIPPEAVIPTSEIEFEGSGRLREDEKIKYTKLAMCEMSEFQTNGYLDVFQQMRMRSTLENIGNNSYFNNKNINKSITEEEGEEGEEESEENEEERERLIRETQKTLLTTRRSSAEAEKLGSRQKFIYAGNMIYPMKNGKGIYLSSAGTGLGIEKNVGTGRGGLVKIERENVQTHKKREFYRYQDHAIFDKGTIDETPFLSEKHLATYSAKLATLLQNMRESKGIIFIYSRYIEAGVIPICLMLEQNGYERYDVGQQGAFLDYSYNKVGGGGKSKPRCYLCNKMFDAPQHKKNNPEYHEYHTSKFILLKGETQQDDIKKIDATRAKEIINNPRNIYGRDIKIIVGTQVTGEGIDFHNIRQIHIMEPWWNNSRIDQIIGRGLRYCSHRELPTEERNVEIFQYSIQIPKYNRKIDQTLYNSYGNRETIDEYIYRIAEEKERKIKEVEYELRSVSVDCLFYKDANYLPPTRKVNVISSRGQRYTLPIGDTPYSKACFYREKCEFKCAWEPELGKKYPVNDDTYDLYFAEEDIRKMKEDVKKLYQVKIVYTINDFKKYFMEKDRRERESSGLIGDNNDDNRNRRNKKSKKDNFLIYKVLDDFIRYKEPVYDSYSREGYLIYRGKYYIYQPKEILDENIPIYYRERPLMYKPDRVDFEEDDLKIVDKKKETVSLYTPSIFLDIVEEYKKLNKTLLYWVKSEEWDKYSYITLLMTLEKYNKSIIEDFIKDLIGKIQMKGSNRNNSNGNNSSNKNKILNRIMNDYKKVEYVLEKNGKIVEFKWNVNKYIWDDKMKEWEQMTIKVEKREKKQFSDIYGYLSKNKKGEYQLKLVDKTEDIGSITLEKKKSKRTEITGRVCGTFQVEYLIQFLEKIGVEFTKDQLKSSKFKNILCNLIEFLLRKRDIMDSKNIWFTNDENKVTKKRVRKIEILDG